MGNIAGFNAIKFSIFFRQARNLYKGPMLIYAKHIFQKNDK